MSRAQKEKRPSVQAQSQPSGTAGGPDKKDGRDRIRPGTTEQPKAAFNGPGRVLKTEA